MNILICYGTRPEWIKVKPLIEAFKNEGVKYKVLQVKQHSNLLDHNVDINYTVDIVDHKSNLNRLDNIISNITNIPEEVFSNITHVLVQGDTATAFMCALAAFHRKISVIHLEAGLRTKDKENPYPEETYRQLITRIADIHFAPTKHNIANLEQECVMGKCYQVGNTVLDNLVALRDKAVYGNEVLITLHRRENHERMDEWFSAISEIALSNPNTVYTLPIHPNPNVQKHKNLLKGVNVIDAIPYEKFIERLVQCKYLISDSGGIQEEASFLGKKVIVCRKITERPETIGLNTTLCYEPKDLYNHELIVRENYVISPNNIYGDGNTSIKIIEILKSI
jgi:UDP-N-acetylglucosamine 2-epimerase (non-hydrolysing)